MLTSAGKDHVLDFLPGIIPLVRGGVCDDDDFVRTNFDFSSKACILLVASNEEEEGGDGSNSW